MIERSARPSAKSMENNKNQIKREKKNRNQKKILPNKQRYESGLY